MSFYINGEGVHVLTFNDTLGTWPCEFGVDGQCNKEAHSIVLTDDEFARLPDPTQEDVAAFIMREGLGKHICKTHLKELQRH
jgi:hypothetical protein